MRRQHSLTALQAVQMVEYQWREMEEVVKEISLGVLGGSGMGKEGWELREEDKVVLKKVRLV